MTTSTTDMLRPDCRSSGGRGVLEGAFALLWALRRAKYDLGLTALADRAGLPKPTAHRLLEQLVLLGMVHRDEGRYRVGAGMFELGQAWLPPLSLHTAARGTIEQLAARTGGSVGLSVRHEDHILVVAGCTGKSGAGVAIRPGMAFPLAVAAGQTLVRGKLAFDRGQIVPDISCVAAPVHSPTGQVIASLVVAVRNSDVDPMADTVQRFAHVVSTACGRFASVR